MTNIVRRLREREFQRKELLREIDRLVDRGLTAEAHERLAATIQEMPGVLALDLRMAELELMAGDHGRAMERFCAVLRSDPSVLAAREGLAVLLRQEGQFGAALDAARWVLEADRMRLRSLRIAAEAAIETGQFAEAVGYLRSWMQIEPQSVAARDLLGLAYLRLGEYGKAGFQLGDLIRQGVGTEATYLNLTLAYAQQKQSKNVADLLMKSSERLDQTRVLAWLVRADFEDVLADPMVASVVDQIRSGLTTAQLLSLPSARSGTVYEKGIGMMPAPDIGINPIDLK